MQWRAIPVEVRIAMGAMKIDEQGRSTSLVLAGSTRLVSLEDCLAACEREGIAGKLTIADEHGVALVTWLEDGRVTYAIPYRTFFEAERVASHLDGISAEELHDAAEHQKVGEGSAVAALAGRGLLRTEEARELAREIALTALLEAMEDTDLRYRIETVDVRPDEARSYDFDLDIDALRMERLRRTDAWHVIEDVISSLNVTMVRSSGGERLQGTTVAHAS